MAHPRPGSGAEPARRRGLRGGGSILTVPLLVYVFGLEPKAAIASSLAVVSAASLAGAIGYWRAGRIELRSGALFGASGIAGAYLGGRTSAFVDGALLLLLFAAMMGLTARAMWRGRGSGARAATGGAGVRLLAQGFGVGLFAGLVGAGGGFLIVPALTLWGGLPMATAVGTSLFIIVLQSLAGLVGYLAHERIDPGLVSAVAGTAIAGALLGARLAAFVDPERLRRGFALVVAAMACVIGLEESGRWLDAARTALPSTLPQVVFALTVLGIGIALGRASQRAGADPAADRAFFSEGEGI